MLGGSKAGVKQATWMSPSLRPGSGREVDTKPDLGIGTVAPMSNVNGQIDTTRGEVDTLDRVPAWTGRSP